MDFENTATVTWNRRLALLWGKIVLFKTVWRYLKVLPHPCPPQWSIPRVRAFKWGTVWRFISRGFKTATTLSFRLSTLLNKSRLFVIFKLRLLLVLMLHEVKCHRVPHLKALTRGIEHWGGQGRASIFRWQKIILKSTPFTS